MAATCGNCGMSGQSVSHVKACYAGTQTPGTVGVAQRNALGSSAAVDAGHTAALEPVEITEGFWKLNGETYKVQRAVHGSGHLYAKHLDTADSEGKPVWKYWPGAMPRLRHEGATPLTEADAAAFGKLYGVCMICSRTLTNESSIARGIGPICAGKQGW